MFWLDPLRLLEHLPKYQKGKVNRDTDVRGDETPHVPRREGVEPVERYDDYEEDE